QPGMIVPRRRGPSNVPPPSKAVRRTPCGTPPMLSSVPTFTCIIISRRVFTSRLRELSAEGKGQRLHAGIEELDLEQAIDDGLRLSDQLMQAGLHHSAVAALVHVDTVRRAGRFGTGSHPVR